ncbi:MAG: hypothetical protein O7I42_18610 [Alphaproteobacteria bacterium]|nr:hypothetical protein [Alphaproteobacteria bacterium]
MRRQAGHAPGSSGGNAGFGRGGAGHGASTLAASILLAGLPLLPKWNALPPTAGDAKGKAYEEEG